MPVADLERQIALLQVAIHEILQRHPQGISEHGLFQALESQQHLGRVHESNLTLFQNHFLLFHALYRLRDQLLIDEAPADIEIHCLKICLLPLAVGIITPPVRHDPLRDYYLDLTNLKETSAGEVERLLDAFWQRFISTDVRAQALETLGLADPVSYDQIKAHYRRLVMEHHPDRGGDKLTLQQINRAMRQLKLFYS